MNSLPPVEVRTEALREVLAATTATGAWEFSVWQDGPDAEPRIRDLDAAVRLGFKEPRDVRELIARIWPENQRPHGRRAVRRSFSGRGNKALHETEVYEYWLTEAELLKLCARARTEVAEVILDEMILVYLAVRRHLLTASTAPVPALPPPPARGTFRDQTEYPWALLREYALAERRRLDPRALDAVADWTVPTGVNLCPALVAELAWAVMINTPPSRGR